MVSVVRARIRSASLLLFALAITALQHPECAEAKYPDRPVRIVLPFAPGDKAGIEKQ